MERSIDRARNERTEEVDEPITRLMSSDEPRVHRQAQPAMRLEPAQDAIATASEPPRLKARPKRRFTASP